jgi:hypothetical protein
LVSVFVFAETAQNAVPGGLSRALANARLNVREERRESAPVVLIALAWQPIEPERYLALASAGELPKPKIGGRVSCAVRAGGQRDARFWTALFNCERRKLVRQAAGSDRRSRTTRRKPWANQPIPGANLATSGCYAPRGPVTCPVLAASVLLRSGMFKRAFLLLPLACLVLGAAWAADDPMVGDWKLNPQKSKLIDEMKVTSLGGNKYSFDFGAGPPETIVVDGTDQPGNFGTTFAVTAVSSG